MIMNISETRMKNGIDPTTRKTNAVYYVMMLVLVLIIGIWTASILIFLTIVSIYIVICILLYLGEAKWIPKEVIIGDEGVLISISARRNVLLKWEQIKAWTQYRRGSHDTYVGIWVEGMKNVYRFEKTVSDTIIGSYYQKFGMQLPKRRLWDSKD